MSTRAKQKRLVSRVRRGVVAAAVAASLGVAGYLGLSTQSASATDTSTGTSTDRSSDGDASTTSFADQNGGSTRLDLGTGDSHATSSGS